MKLLFIMSLLVLSACATPHSGPVADAGSTAVALNTIEGATEMNPLLAPAGPVGGPILSMGIRTAVNRSVRGKEECLSVAGFTNAIGWGAACNNIAASLGAAPQIGIPLLVICTVVVKKTQADETEAWCGKYELTDLSCTLNNIPVGAQSARCIDNRMAWK